MLFSGVEGMLNKFLLGVWNVGIIEKPVQSILKDKDNYSVRWVKHKYKDRFFADPFLYKVDDKNYYILVEEFPFYSNVGYISLLTVERKTMKLTKKVKCIQEPWHLSYPFVYKGQIIPEAYRSGRVYSYNFSGETISEKKVIFNSGLIDQTFLEYNGLEWIFATSKEDALAGLKIYYRKDAKDEWKEHSKNPVKNDITSSRPGGHFFQFEGVLYRPVQDSKERYGRRIRIMRVDKLSVDEFKETEVAVFDSDRFPPYNKGLHTFNVEGEFVVVDGYKEKHSFFIKPMCVKLPSLMKKLGEKR